MNDTTETTDWSLTETPSLSDVIDTHLLVGGVVDGLTRLTPHAHTISGPAHTATVIDSTDPDIPGLAEFLDSARPGDMLVVGWQATSTISTFGGLAATRTEHAGAVGLVIDGWVRDLEEVRSTALTVWARGTTPRSGKGRLAVTGIGEPTTVGGVTVTAGDQVVADATGICVIGAADSTAAYEHARELQRRDELFRQGLADGAGFGAARASAGTM